MTKKLLKINSLVLIIIGVIAMISVSLIALLFLKESSGPKGWDELTLLIITIAIMVFYALNIPLIVSGVCTLKHLKGKNTYPVSMILGVFGIVIHTIMLILFIIVDKIYIFTDFTTGYANTTLQIALCIIVFIFVICPLLINAILLYKDKNKLDSRMLWKRLKYFVFVIGTIIIIIIIYAAYLMFYGRGKIIQITDDNTYTYSDFNKELEERGLLQKNIYGITELKALDSKNKYGYSFTTTEYRNYNTLGVGSDRKFPLFVYSAYTSLIEKSYNRRGYYSIDSTDWYITWYIYYVNGQIYAAIGEESQYNKSWEVSLAKTKYAIVVSEEDYINIYNSKKDYYVKGGGIKDTRSGMDRTVFPTTSDTYNKNCMTIWKVKRLDAETLDSIAKELSPQYWKEYKKNLGIEE